MGVTYIPAGPNPWAGLFGTLGMIMGDNARKRNEDAIGKVYGDLMYGNQGNPFSTPPTDQNGNKSTAVPQGQGMLNLGGQKPEDVSGPTAPNGGFYKNPPAPNGLLTAGNIDLNNRPIVKNPDGSISTVRTMTFNIDGKEVNIPTVSDDGRIMSNEEAIDTFKKTGKHLGMFDTVDNAVNAAKQLHLDQEKMYVPKANQASPELTIPDKYSMRSQYRQQEAAAVKELVRRGIDAKTAITTVRDLVNQRVEEDYGMAADKYARHMDSTLDGLVGVDYSKEGEKSKALGTLAKYSVAMKRIGREGVDMSLMKEIINQGDVTIQKEDNGGQYRYVMMKKNGEKFSDGSYMVPIPGNAGEWTDKQVSPDTRYSQEQANYRHVTPSGSAIVAANSRVNSGGGEDGLSKQEQAALTKSTAIVNNFRSKYFDTVTNQWRDGYQNDPAYQAYTSAVQVQNEITKRIATSMRKDAGIENDGFKVQKTGNAKIDSNIEKARAMGIPEKDIQAAVEKELQDLETNKSNNRRMTYEEAWDSGLLSGPEG